MSEHTEHHDSATTLGWSDLILGAIAFLFVSEAVFHIIGVIKPGLFSQETLFEMRLSGGLFFLVWAALGRGVFESFFESAYARQEATVGASSNAQEMCDEVVQLEAKLEESLRESRLKGIRNRDAQVDIAKKEAAKVVEVAKRDNASELAAANEELQKLRVEAETELEGEASELKQLVIDRVLAESRALH